MIGLGLCKVGLGIALCRFGRGCSLVTWLVVLLIYFDDEGIESELGVKGGSVISLTWIYHSPIV